MSPGSIFGVFYMAEGNDYIEVSIITENEAENDILLAQLSAIGFEGFEEEENLLKAFIIAKDFDEQLLQPIIHQIGGRYTTSLIKYKNWNEAWEAGFEPVVIENFCSIRAVFHQPAHGVKHDIIITPKMSFGTGHHATTYLMIEAMRKLAIQGKSVFDFGTGTGVLAILAEKMGASLIEAIDIDDWSIENGLENLQQNECKKILLYKSDEIATVLKFDIILANINKNIILKYLISMKEHLLPGGVIILSGLLSADEEAVIYEANRVHLKLNSIAERKNWICLQFVKPAD